MAGLVRSGIEPSAGQEHATQRTPRCKRTRNSYMSVRRVFVDFDSFRLRVSAASRCADLRFSQPKSKWRMANGGCCTNDIHVESPVEAGRSLRRLEQQAVGQPASQVANRSENPKTAGRRYGRGRGYRYGDTSGRQPTAIIEPRVARESRREPVKGGWEECEIGGLR